MSSGWVHRASKGPGHGGPAKGPGHGGPAKGPSAHGEGCTCVRCRGFEEGNTHGLVHGGFVTPAFYQEFLGELMDMIRPLVPIGREADEMAIGQLALALLREDRMVRYQAKKSLEGDDEAVAKSDDRLTRLQSLIQRQLNDLGMTPTARARLKVDVATAIAKAETLTVFDLHAMPTPKRSRAASRAELVPDE